MKRKQTGGPVRGRDWRGRAVGGFNLLPWRQREIQRLRRRRLAEWGAAALLGCACAVPLAGWQLWERSRAEARRVTVEAQAVRWRAPYAEAQRLEREVVALKAAAQLSAEHGKPLKRVVVLFDALANAGNVGVALQRIAQKGEETELQAAVVSERTAAAWLGHLRAIEDVETVSVRELKRTGPRANAKERERSGEPIRIVVRLGWRGAAPVKVASTVPRDSMRNTK